MLRIGYIVFPGFGVMSFAAMSVFETTNSILETANYEVRLLSEKGGLVRSSIGVSVETEAFGDDDFDTIIIGGGGNMPFTDGLSSFLAKAEGRVRRLAATCTGAFFLAEAGVLQNKLVTTHWFFAQDFSRRFPSVNLDENRLFVIDGKIWTSAGMTAGVDQALAMVEEDLGAEVAKSVSKNLILHHRRSGGLPQVSALLEMDPKSSRVQKAMAWAREHLDEQLDTESLAEVANLSPRQFARVFFKETGWTPAKAIERIRVEAARVLVQEGRHPIEAIARDTGFRDRERMRKAFVRVFGEPPQRLRARTERPGRLE